MYEVDAAVTQAINGLAGKSTVIDFLMIWVSAIGVPLLVLAVAGQWWRRGERQHIRHVLVATGFSFLLGLALNQLITATVAIAAAFLLRGRRRLGLWFLAAAALVIVSRVHIGTHYVSDVLGGALTGIIAAVLVRALYWKGTRADRVLTGIS